MGKSTSVLTAIAAAMSAGEAAAQLDEAQAPSSKDDLVTTTPVRASGAAVEVIEGKLRTIDYSSAIRTAQAGSYWRYRAPYLRKGGPMTGPMEGAKEPFARFPDHFKQDRPGPFSNFYRGEIGGERINPSPMQQQQMQRLQQMQRMQQNRLETPVDVQAAFDQFKDS